MAELPPVVVKLLVDGADFDEKMDEATAKIKEFKGIYESALEIEHSIYAVKDDLITRLKVLVAKVVTSDGALTHTDADEIALLHWCVGSGDSPYAD